VLIRESEPGNELVAKRNAKPPVGGRPKLPGEREIRITLSLVASRSVARFPNRPNPCVYLLL